MTATIATERDLEYAIIRLVRSEPFYGSVLLGMTRSLGPAAKVGTDTAGVMIRQDTTVHLRVCDEFFGSLSNDEQEGLLIHECLHIMHMHLLRRDDMPLAKLANIGMDLAINQYIDRKRLPACGCFIDSPPFKQLRLEPDKIADYYYNKLKQQHDKFKQELQDMLDDGRLKLLDDHDWDSPDEGGGAGSGEVPEIIKEAALRSLLNDARQQAKATSSWGTLPAGLQRLINDFLAPKVDWRQELRRFVGDRVRVAMTGTRKRPNRRYRWKQPGKKPVRSALVLVAVDTSGSISEKDLEQFFAEINAIHGSGKVSVVVADVDADVHRVWEYDRRSASERCFEGGGGTDYKILWERLAQGKSYHKLFGQKFDGIVYLQDGMPCRWPDASDHKGLPTLWVSTTDIDGAARSGFGKNIRIEVDNGRGY